MRRVHAVLTRSDDPEVASVSLDLVRKLMQENDLHACQPRAYKVTTISGTAPPAIADHLKRDFTATAPGTRLVGDITYVRTWAGWLYLIRLSTAIPRRLWAGRWPIICALSVVT